MLLATFLLMSCTTVQLNIHAESQEKTLPITEESTKSKSSKLTCSFYHLPQFDPVPEIPIEEFNQLKQSDKDAKINLLVDHIRELRT